MPTYEYKCLDCSTQFEKFQSITADPIRECPKCNGPVKRLIGAGAGLIFKGSGFYITDYRGDSYKEAAKKDKESTSSSSESSKNGDSKSSKSESSGDSKSNKSESSGDSKSSKSESSGDSKSNKSKSSTSEA